MPFEEDRTYTYTGTVQVGKFAVVKPGTGASDFVLSAAENDPLLGVLIDERGVVPELASSYSGGSYGGISGNAWPNNVKPTSPSGLKRTVRKRGRAQCIATGAISRLDRVISAGNGTVMSAETARSGLPAGTPIFVLGLADTAAVNNGDLVYVDVNPHKETV